MKHVLMHMTLVTQQGAGFATSKILWSFDLLFEESKNALGNRVVDLANKDISGTSKGYETVPDIHSALANRHGPVEVV